MSRTPLLVALTVGLSLFGCTDDPKPEAPPNRDAPKSAATPNTTPQSLEIQDAGGTVQVRIVARSEGGFRLLDGAGKKIGKLTVESDRVKVKDASGRLRAKVWVSFLILSWPSPESLPFKITTSPSA